MQNVGLEDLSFSGFSRKCGDSFPLQATQVGHQDAYDKCVKLCTETSSGLGCFCGRQRFRTPKPRDLTPKHRSRAPTLLRARRTPDSDTKLSTKALHGVGFFSTKNHCALGAEVACLGMWQEVLGLARVGWDRVGQHRVGLGAVQ